MELLSARVLVHCNAAQLAHAERLQCCCAGFPESGSVQEVLYFQTQTIRCMYLIIAEALRDMGITNEHPRDYLIFLTIGQHWPSCCCDLLNMAPLACAGCSLMSDDIPQIPSRVGSFWQLV